MTLAAIADARGGRTTEPAASAVAVLVADVRRAHPRADSWAFGLPTLSWRTSCAGPSRCPCWLPASRNSVRRIAPGSEFGRVCAIAYAVAAAAAIDLHRRPRAARRRSDRGRPEPARQGRRRGCDALLDDDAIAPAARLGGMSDRGMRRLCDRLVTLGAARELTGPPCVSACTVSDMARRENRLR